MSELENLIYRTVEVKDGKKTIQLLDKKSGGKIEVNAKSGEGWKELPYLDYYKFLITMYSLRDYATYQDIVPEILSTDNLQQYIEEFLSEDCEDIKDRLSRNDKEWLADKVRENMFSPWKFQQNIINFGNEKDVDILPFNRNILTFTPPDNTVLTTTPYRLDFSDYRGVNLTKYCTASVSYDCVDNFPLLSICGSYIGLRNKNFPTFVEDNIDLNEKGYHYELDILAESTGGSWPDGTRRTYIKVHRFPISTKS